MALSIHTLRQVGYAEGYLALGMKDHAAEALDEIAAAERDATRVWVTWLAVHVERGDWTRAAEAGAVACEREPQVAGHWIQWAYATRRCADLAAARSILRRGAVLHPREPVFPFNLACYEAQLGNLVEARALLATACTLDEAFIDLAKTDSDLEPLRSGGA